MKIDLIKEVFITEQKNKLEIGVSFEDGWYVFKIIKADMYLGEFKIPDANYDDKPIPNSDMQDRISELIPHLHKIINIFEKP